MIKQFFSCREKLVFFKPLGKIQLWYQLFVYIFFHHLPLLFLLNSGIGLPILEASSPMTRSLIGSYIWGLFDRRPMRGDEGIILAPEKKIKKFYKLMMMD